MRSWQENLAAANNSGVGTTSEPAPPSEYLIEITKAESKPSSNGKPMIVATCRIVAGPYSGTTIWHNFVLSEDSDSALRTRPSRSR